MRRTKKGHIHLCRIYLTAVRIDNFTWQAENRSARCLTSQRNNAAGRDTVSVCASGRDENDGS